MINWEISARYFNSRCGDGNGPLRWRRVCRRAGEHTEWWRGTTDCTCFQFSTCHQILAVTVQTSVWARAGVCAVKRELQRRPTSVFNQSQRFELSSDTNALDVILTWNLRNPYPSLQRVRVLLGFSSSGKVHHSPVSPPQTLSQSLPSLELQVPMVPRLTVSKSDF